jgi:hypothetical protein
MRRRHQSKGAGVIMRSWTDVFIAVVLIVVTLLVMTGPFWLVMALP